MIELLLPSPVHAVEVLAPAAPPELFAEEEAVIAAAVGSRREEFATVRGCARAALAHFGQPPVPLLRGPRGAPAWPAGFVGSMTHCAGYRAAAVARSAEVVTLGIDAEPDAPLPAGLLQRVARAEEARSLAALPAEDGVAWDRLLFSAKEAVYKAWFPLARRWLGFQDAVVGISPADGTFTVRLLVEGPVTPRGPLTGFTGRWLSRRGLLLTAIAVLAVPDRRRGTPPP